MTMTLLRGPETSSETYRPVPKAFDLEGIILLPAVDLAWMMIRSVSEYLKQRFSEDRVKKFDDWDDLAWLHEHNFLREEDGKIVWDIETLRNAFFHAPPTQRFVGHSTGTTPIIADLIAACDGMDNKRLIEL